MTRFVEPKAYLVSKTNVDWDAIAAFLADEDLPDLSHSVRAGDDGALATAEVAARLCYMSFGRGRRDIGDFIRNLLESRDGSVFEHISYGFLFTGVSRSLTHELVRHRAGFAYSQRSQRYVDEADCAFVLPPAIAERGWEARRVAEDAFGDAASAYKRLIEALDDGAPRVNRAVDTARRKKAREAARSVLPNAAETKIMVTANARAWRHFIEMRASEYADAEIRRLALMVLRRLREEAPLLFGDFEIKQDASGAEIAIPAYSKV